MDHHQTVRELYQLAFHREPDPTGLDYYIDKLKRGYSTQGIAAQLARDAIRQGATPARELINRAEGLQSGLQGLMYRLRLNPLDSSVAREQRVFQQRVDSRLSMLESSLNAVASRLADTKTPAPEPVDLSGPITAIESQITAKADWLTAHVTNSRFALCEHVDAKTREVLSELSSRIERASFNGGGHYEPTSTGMQANPSPASRVSTFTRRFLSRTN